jgi:hypothetical protein
MFHRSRRFPIGQYREYSGRKIAPDSDGRARGGRCGLASKGCRYSPGSIRDIRGRWFEHRDGWRTSRPAGRLSRGTTAIGIAADSETGGYWILKSNGGVANFHAPWHGSLESKVPAGSEATAIAAGRPGGYLVLTSDGGVHNFGTPS